MSQVTINECMQQSSHPPKHLWRKSTADLESNSNSSLPGIMIRYDTVKYGMV